jgi:bacillolysin/neutral peptidase B
MTENGLTTFAMHADDADVAPTITGIGEDITRADRDRSIDVDLGTLDAESAARRYLAQMLASPGVPGLTAEPEYRPVGTETQPLTGTTVVRFAQYLHRIPVYGSLVTIELGAANELVSVSSALGDPTGVDPMATVAPADAYAVVRAHAGGDAAAGEELPRLYFYFDVGTDPARWRLVYIARRVRRDGPADPDAPAPELADCVVDAHSGDLVATLSRTRTVDPRPEKWLPASTSATDALGRPQTVRVQRHPETDAMRMNDPVRNVRTHDFAFQDVARVPGLLPGAFVGNPPQPWDRAATSAHAHATAVAEFLLTVLRRDGLDGAGGPIVSSINCTFRRTGPNQREWRNAAWFDRQMIYGQRLVQGRLQSYAVAKDVVAHEIVHGLTENTADLVYERESGALNESYSDLLGIIIANADEPDLARWDWEMGEDLDATGQPLRDVSDPTRTNDPDHMDDFQVLSGAVRPAQDNDFGFVHTNSGIHNKAGFNLITARRPDGTPVFTPAEAAALFFLCLTRRLSRTSGFADSRRGIEVEARSLFRADPPPERDVKLAAIADAFDAVGIGAA